MILSFFSGAGFLLSMASMYLGLYYVYKPKVLVGYLRLVPFVTTAIANYFMIVGSDKGFTDWLQLFSVYSLILIVFLLVGLFSKNSDGA